MVMILNCQLLSMNSTNETLSFVHFLVMRNSVFCSLILYIIFIFIVLYTCTYLGSSGKQARSPRHSRNHVTTVATMTAMVTNNFYYEYCNPMDSTIPAQAVSKRQPTGHYLAKTFPLPPGNEYGCCRRKT